MRHHRRNALSLTASAVVIAVGVNLFAWAVRADAPWFDQHWLASYCPVSRATPALETMARALLGSLGIALVGAALSVVPRWIARRDSARLLRTFAGTVLAVGLALLVADGVLRWRRHRKPDVADEPALPPMHLDASGNYAPTASQTKNVSLATRHIQYAIDAEGNRAASADHIADPALPTVLFGGESITLGWGVPYDASYPAIVGAAMGVQSANLAVTGFANDQAYLRVRDALVRFERPVAVVMLAIASQLERNVNVQRDRLTLSNGHLEMQRATTSLLATSPLRDLLFYHSDEAIVVARAIFRATIDAAVARGARPLFIWTNFGPPCLTDDSGRSRLEASLFEGLPAAQVSVLITPELTIQSPNELHPNERGHRLIAQAILAALRAPGPLSR